MTRRVETVEGLALMLHGQRLGVVAHFAGGRNILSFDPAWRAQPAAQRPVFTLTQLQQPDYFEQPQLNAQRLPTVLSNLLPEGALREWMAANLRVHTANEFPLLAWTGADLPGALEALPLAPGEIPYWALSARERVEPVQIDVSRRAQSFSLAGVQMKFSSERRDGRYAIGQETGADSWIIKTPSTVHPAVPQNEYSAMKLAETLGVQIPEIALIDLARLDQLPDIPLPAEPQAYAIRRFDRTPQGRVHSEDFAQIFQYYAHDKYQRANYEMIGAALYRYGAEGLADLQQMARRLLANILLGNGDAHLKNWSLCYPDRYSPRLSPAYDIVTTLAYVADENGTALNMARQKQWQTLDLAAFETWCLRIGAPWPAIRVHLLDALEKARTRWPQQLAQLPMRDDHKALLKQHWQGLAADLRIG